MAGIVEQHCLTLSNAGAVFHGRASSNADIFLRTCFLRGILPPESRLYEVMLAKYMEAYLSAEENKRVMGTTLDQLISHC